MRFEALPTAVSPASSHRPVAVTAAGLDNWAANLRRVFTVALMGLALHCFPVFAQYSADWSTIAGGGGPLSGADYSIEATIGQAEAGPILLSPNYSIQGGFWILDDSTGSVTNSSPGAPFITQHPSGVAVQVGSSFTLSVRATGDAPLTYQWYQNGTLLSSTSSNYSVVNAQIAASGQYQAVVTNQAGKTISSIAEVNVFSNNRPEITQQPSSQTVSRSSTATFSVSATGQAPLSYMWRKDGQAISGASNPTLVLNNVQLSQAGQYTVLIANDDSELLSQPAVLKVVIPVNEPPRIVKQPQDLEIKEGALAVFTVVVDSEAAAGFQWYHSDQLIPSATGATLSMSFATQANVGPYTVVVRNIHGSVTSGAANLIVNAPVELPVLTRTPQSQTVPIGGTATFSVEAEGPAPFSYQWLRDGEPIPSAQGADLVLNNLQDSATGYYAVRVRNPGGTMVSDSALLKVVDPAVMAQTRLEFMRDPEAIRLHTPATEGSFSITLADQVSDDPLAGEPFANGVLTGASDYTFPLDPSNNAGFFQAQVEPTPTPSQESNMEEEESETQSMERLFAWENPVRSLAPGSQFEVRGQIVNASLEPLTLSGSLELYVVNQRTGLPKPGLAVQPAVLPIQAGHVQGTALIVGNTADSVGLQIKVRIVTASALAQGLQAAASEPTVSDLQDFVHGVEKNLLITAQITAPWAAPLKLPWKIVGSFGEWPRGDEVEKNWIHHGIDMKVPAGTDVYAVEDGYICHIDTASVWINHGNGYFSRYLHTWPCLDNGRVGLNATVARGDLIGKTSSPGKRALPKGKAPHLHFEMWRAYPTPDNYVIGSPRNGIKTKNGSPEISAFGSPVHPQSTSTPGFTPALTCEQESPLPPELVAIKVVPSTPAKSEYELSEDGVQASVNNRGPTSFFVVQAVDRSNGRRLMINKLIIQPEGLPATTNSIIDANLEDLNQRVDNPVVLAPDTPGYANFPEETRILWGDHVNEFYRLWMPFTPANYHGSGDGPKTLRLDLEGMMGEKTYALCYGVLIRSYNLVKSEAGWARFTGEVVLYNGSKDKPACRQMDHVVLKGKGGDLYWGKGRPEWPKERPSPTEVKEIISDLFGKKFGEVRNFTFDVPASYVGNCDSSDANAPSLQAHMGALPAITHLVTIHSNGGSLALIPASLKLEAGTPAELAITGLSPNGTRIPLPARDFQWSVQVVKTGNLMPLPQTQKGTITYWGNPTPRFISSPLVLRADVDKLTVLGMIQGAYILTANDSKGRSACARVQVSKTLVPMLGVVMLGPLNPDLEFVASSPAPDASLSSGSEVVVSGAVIKPGGEIGRVCGLLNIELRDDSGELNTELLHTEPSQLQIYEGNVSAKVKIVDLTGMVSHPKFSFKIEEDKSKEHRPPPELTFSSADEVTGTYDGPNRLGRFMQEWLGWELPVYEDVDGYDSFAAYTVDVPADEDVIIKFTPNICGPYFHLFATLGTVGLENGLTIPKTFLQVGGKPLDPDRYGDTVRLRRSKAY